MKNINEFIIEKILISKNTTVYDNVNIDKCIGLINDWLIINTIHEVTQRDYVINIIKKWIKDNNVDPSEIICCTDFETINSLPARYKYKISFITDDDVNEKCQNELDNATHIYSLKNDSMDIYYTDKMICNITKYGTLYVIVKSKFNI